jgi:chromosome segregation ATPase
MLGGIDPTISKTKLLSTADIYLSVLKSEVDGFNKDFPSIIEGAVGESKKKVDENNREIDSLKAQLSSINSKIQELNEANATLSDEVAQQQVKLDRMKADFDVTSASVNSDLQEVVDLIKAHIQDDQSDESSK